jgi:hypothetical protein
MNDSSGKNSLWKKVPPKSKAKTTKYRVQKPTNFNVKIPRDSIDEMPIMVMITRDSKTCKFQRLDA